VTRKELKRRLEGGRSGLDGFREERKEKERRRERFAGVPSWK
jgi:hypothetical protein